MMPTMHFELHPGDVVLTAGSSVLARLIRWSEVHKANPQARVNHAALCVGTPDLIVEAATVARKTSLWRFHADDGILIYRSLDLTADQKQVLVTVAETWIGRPYPVGHLLAYLIDNKVFGGRTVARWLLTLKPNGVCSRLVASAFAALGLDFGVPEPDPDDMDDFCRTHPDKYQLVYSQRIPEVAGG